MAKINPETHALEAEAEDIAAIAAQLAALRERVEHTCLNCGETFTAIKTAKYCSNRCRQAAKYAREKAR